MPRFILNLPRAAAIAEKLLDQSAANAITTWLGTEDSMITVAIEPDIYRYGNGKWTSSFHYCNLPRKFPHDFSKRSRITTNTLYIVIIVVVGLMIYLLFLFLKMRSWFYFGLRNQFAGNIIYFNI